MGIKKVAVIGSGVMGSGIAAHVANAGFPVILLDIVPEGAESRNQLAENAVAHQLKVGGFMHSSAAELVSTGNLEDDLDLLLDADWIVEAIIERLDIKSGLYSKIDQYRKPGSIVSSNTSTIPLDLLVKGQSASFQKDFLVTHFFNPPRHMRLLELVGGKQTRPNALQQVREFADIHLGKGIVDCKDTPGFIANRIGVYWMQAGLLSAFEHDVTVEEADAVMSRPVGIPKTGVFGLWDLVGIDLGPHLIESMTSTLDPSDPFHQLASTPDRVTQMIKDGYIGRKGKGGFYRMNKSDGKKQMESLNLSSGEYHPLSRVELASLSASKSGLRALIEHDDRGGQYAWDVLSKTLSYAASLVPEICDDIYSVDEAMRLGYAWQFGPFELIDQLGAEWFSDRLRNEGRCVPAILDQLGSQRFYRFENGKHQQFGLDGNYRDISRAAGVLLLSDIKLNSEALAQNDSASLWDIGDKVACLEFHTKMNAINPDIHQMISKSISIVEEDFNALVLYNEGKAFSAGANLELISNLLQAENWSEIGQLIEQGQQTYRSLQAASFPVVGAPSGLALGGGCEVLLHCDAIQAHAETYTGLVEISVGLIPAWGGCKEMLKRWNLRVDKDQAAMETFRVISTAKISGSAAEAREMGILKLDDRITMNADRLLADAKSLAISLAENYQPGSETHIPIAGDTTKQQLLTQLTQAVTAGKATPYDQVVATELAHALTAEQSDDASEEDIYRKERQAFDSLVRNQGTRDRINHLLKTGKPLRN